MFVLMHVFMLAKGFERLPQLKHVFSSRLSISDFSSLYNILIILELFRLANSTVARNLTRNFLSN